MSDIRNSRTTLKIRSTTRSEFIGALGLLRMAEIRYRPCSELSWSHFRQLMRVAAPKARALMGDGPKEAEP